jgi:hypothetical protein
MDYLDRFLSPPPINKIVGFQSYDDETHKIEPLENIINFIGKPIVLIVNDEKKRGRK